MPRQTKREKEIDAAVDAAFQRHGSHVQFNIIDLGKIMEAGREALRNGTDLDTAMTAVVEQYRQN